MLLPYFSLFPLTAVLSAETMAAASAVSSLCRRSRGGRRSITAWVGANSGSDAGGSLHPSGCPHQQQWRSVSFRAQFGKKRGKYAKNEPTFYNRNARMNEKWNRDDPDEDLEGVVFDDYLDKPPREYLTRSVPHETRREMFKLWTQDPVRNSLARLSQRYKVHKKHVAGFIRLLQFDAEDEYWGRTRPLSQKVWESELRTRKHNLREMMGFPADMMGELEKSKAMTWEERLEAQKKFEAQPLQLEDARGETQRVLYKDLDSFYEQKFIEECEEDYPGLEAPKHPIDVPEPVHKKYGFMFADEDMKGNEMDKDFVDARKTKYEKMDHPDRELRDYIKLRDGREAKRKAYAINLKTAKKSPKRRDFQMAMKDISDKDSPTLLRSRSGHLRFASEEEEQLYSWSAKLSWIARMWPTPPGLLYARGNLDVKKTGYMTVRKKAPRPPSRDYKLPPLPSV